MFFKKKEEPPKKWYQKLMFWKKEKPKPVSAWRRHLKKIATLSIAGALLVAFQLAWSIDKDNTARDFVSDIKGYQVGPIVYDKDGLPAQVLIAWKPEVRTQPPQCDMYISSIVTHTDTGYSEADEPFLLELADFYNIHNSKNGRISVEPIFDSTIAEAMKNNPGVWQYELIFRFDCSIIDSEWLTWFKSDNIYYTAPVFLDTEFGKKEGD